MLLAIVFEMLVNAFCVMFFFRRFSVKVELSKTLLNVFSMFFVVIFDVFSVTVLFVVIFQFLVCQFFVFHLKYFST